MTSSGVLQTRFSVGWVVPPGLIARPIPIVIPGGPGAPPRGQTSRSASRSMAAPGVPTIALAKSGVPGPPFTIFLPGGPATPWAAIVAFDRPFPGRVGSPYPQVQDKCPAHPLLFSVVPLRPHFRYPDPPSTVTTVPVV